MTSPFCFIDVNFSLKKSKYFFDQSFEGNWVLTLKRCFVLKSYTFKVDIAISVSLHVILQGYVVILVKFYMCQFTPTCHF